MLQILKYLFAFAATAEGGLYLLDSASPEVMATDTWSIQEVRLVIVVLSAIAFTVLHFWKEEEAK